MYNIVAARLLVQGWARALSPGLAAMFALSFAGHALAQQPEGVDTPGARTPQLVAAERVFDFERLIAESLALQEAGVEQNADGESPLLLAGRWLAALGRHGEAAAALSEWVGANEESPRTMEVLWALADQQGKAGESEQMAQTLTAFLDRYREDPQPSDAVRDHAIDAMVRLVRHFEQIGREQQSALLLDEMMSEVSARGFVTETTTAAAAELAFERATAEWAEWESWAAEFAEVGAGDTESERVRNVERLGEGVAQGIQTMQRIGERLSSSVFADTSEWPMCQVAFGGSMLMRFTELLDHPAAGTCAPSDWEDCTDYTPEVQAMVEEMIEDQRRSYVTAVAQSLTGALEAARQSPTRHFCGLLAARLLLRNGVYEAPPFLAAPMSLVEVQPTLPPRLAEPPVSDDSQAQTFTAGVSAARQGDMEVARGSFESVATAPGLAAAALHNLGVIEYYAGSYDAALARFEEAWQRDPARDDSLEALVRMELAALDVDAARARVNAAVAAQGDNAVLAGIALYPLLEEGRYQEAIDAGRQLLIQDPTHLRVQFVLATAYDAMGMPEPAKFVLETAVQDHPENVDLQWMLARLQAETGDVAGAAARLAPVPAYELFNPELLVERASVRLAEGKVAEAIEDLYHARRLAPTHPVVLHQLASALLLANRFQEAADILLGTPGIGQVSPQSAFNLATLYLVAPSLPAIAMTPRAAAEAALPLFRFAAEELADPRVAQAFIEDLEWFLAQEGTD